MTRPIGVFGEHLGANLRILIVDTMRGYGPYSLAFLQRPYKISRILQIGMSTDIQPSVATPYPDDIQDFFLQVEPEPRDDDRNFANICRYQQAYWNIDYRFVVDR